MTIIRGEMWMRTEIIVALLCFLSCYDTAISQESLEVTEHAKLLDKLLLALQQVSKFYNKEYQNVNLDSIYGVRVAEGALKSTLEDINSGAAPRPSPKVLFTVNNLYSQFSGIARKSLHYLEKTAPEYYHKFSKVVAEPWDYFKDYKRLDHPVAIPLEDKKEIDFGEEMSDGCMTGLMGSANKTAEPCQISDKCWKLMSTRGYKEYVTTHQVLFFILGDIQGCRNQLESRLKTTPEHRNNIEDMVGELCADIYPEMVDIQKQGYPIHDRDLFMEQGIVCGMLGYYEFLNKERLEKVLSWKTPRGCYGFQSKDEADLTMDDYERKIVGKKENIIRVSYPEKKAFKKRKLMSMDTRRKLLVETSLEGGCMAHMTGVAVGLLGLYVKWMVAKTALEDSQATHVIKARSIYSYEPPLASNTFSMLWPLVGVFLTVIFVGYIVFKNRAMRLFKRMLTFSAKNVIHKDIKYIA